MRPLAHWRTSVRGTTFKAQSAKLDLTVNCHKRPNKIMSRMMKFTSELLSIFRRGLESVGHFKRAQHSPKDV